MRKLKFKLLTQSGLFSLETDAYKLSDLKTLIKSDSELMRKFGVPDDSDLSELNLIEFSTKTSYMLDESVLPAGDTLFFVSLMKSKGGAYFGESIDLNEVSTEDMQEIARVLNDKYDAGIDVNLEDSELQDELDNFYMKVYEEDSKGDLESLIDEIKLLKLSILSYMELRQYAKELNEFGANIKTSVTRSKLDYIKDIQATIASYTAEDDLENVVQEKITLDFATMTPREQILAISSLLKSIAETINDEAVIEKFAHGITMTQLSNETNKVYAELASKGFIS